MESGTSELRDREHEKRPKAGMRRARKGSNTGRGEARTTPSLKPELLLVL